MNKNERRDLVEYRIEKAEKTFDEIPLLIENGLWNTAVNRLYYSCYYAVTALLINKEIKTSTHSGTRQMFGLHFIKTEILEKDLGKFYSDIFDLRQTGDYEDYQDFKKEDVMDLLPSAELLITSIKSLLKINH